MSGGDWIVIIVLGIILLLIFTRSRKKKKNGCSGHCATCSTGCGSIDWNQIRKDIHAENKPDAKS